MRGSAGYLYRSAPALEHLSVLCAGSARNPNRSNDLAVNEERNAAFDGGCALQAKGVEIGMGRPAYADLSCAGDGVKRISITSNPAPTTIALSATLNAGH
jgi:hypothetical protein